PLNFVELQVAGDAVLALKPPAGDDARQRRFGIGGDFGGAFPAARRALRPAAAGAEFDIGSSEEPGPDRGPPLECDGGMGPGFGAGYRAGPAYFTYRRIIRNPAAPKRTASRSRAIVWSGIIASESQELASHWPNMKNDGNRSNAAGPPRILRRPCAKRRNAT